jgi:pantetheine-phosphate adenylyltransferase
MKKVLFAGSFDPITLGHYDMVVRASALFEEVVVALGANSTKQTYFSKEVRLTQLNQVFSNFKNVTVAEYEGLTVDFAQKCGAKFLLRGLRNGTDFNYEQSIAQMNFQISGIDTYFLLTQPHLSHISSSVVRDLLKHGRDCSDLLPPNFTLPSKS